MYRIGRLRLYLALFAIAVIESTLIQSIAFKGARPNLMLIFVIFVGLYSDWKEALEAGIVAGLLRGAFSTGAVGINMSAFSLCGLITTYCSNKVFKDSFLTQLVLAFAVTAVFNSLILMSWHMIKSVEAVTVNVRDVVVSRIILISCYTAAVTPAAFLILKRLLSVREDRLLT